MTNKYILLIFIILNTMILSAQITKPIKVIKKPSKAIAKPLPMLPKAPIGNTCGINWVEVTGGNFTMGCSSNQGSTCLNTSKPAHTVTLSDFRLSIKEITNSQYAKFLNVQQVSSSGFHNDPNFGNVEYIDMKSPNCMIKYNHSTGYFEVENDLKNYPVIEVSWYGANAYANWKCGRLPTEAEWEYAARGGIYEGSGYKFSGSNNLNAVSWNPSNSNSAGKSNYNGINTHPVGTKLPNQIGLYDMTGNVMEWCSDWYGNYSSSAQLNPNGPTASSVENQKVIRGGGWFSNSTHTSIMQLSARYGATRNKTGKATGFRVAYSKPIDCPDLVINGRTYKTVVIGNQCWMAENLNEISHTNGSSWCYDNNSNKCITNGRLYNWDAAMDIADSVSGWHLPTNQDWTQLFSNFGGLGSSGSHLRINGSSGFNALLDGYRHNIHQSFSDFNSNSYYWSSTLGAASIINSAQIPYAYDISWSSNVQGFNTSKDWGFSVRLVKD